MSTNYSIGHNAEKRAAEYLSEQGFDIRELNWKTKYCEIDIIAEKTERSKLLRKEKTIFFVEVKYRRNDNQGKGYEYVTPKKLEQMKFAAEMWANEYEWEGDYQLAVLSIDGEKFTFIDEI